MIIFKVVAITSTVFVTFKVAVMTSSVTENNFVVAVITFEVAVMTSYVVITTFIVTEITFLGTDIRC